MKKNFKKLMALAIATMTIATNSVSANAATFNLHYTSGAPSWDNVVEDVYSAEATNTSYMRLVCTNFNQAVAYASVTVTCYKYPITSTRFSASVGTNMTYISAKPRVGEHVGFDFQLNDYVPAKYVTATGFIG